MRKQKIGRFLKTFGFWTFVCAGVVCFFLILQCERQESQDTKAQHEATVSQMQKTIDNFDNLLAVKKSDIDGLREEKFELENQLAASEQTLKQTRLRLKTILSKYRNALTRVENLKSLRDIYYGYKLELDISEARFSEKIQKCNGEKAQLQKENEELQISLNAFSVQEKK